MLTFDTNVVVRVLVGDDPEQTLLAEHAFVQNCRGDGVFLAVVTIAELGWVLSAGYEWDRDMIHDRLSRLIRTRGVFVEQPDLVATAVKRYGDGGADLADLLIAGEAHRVGALPLLTFDQRLAREPGVRLLTS